MTFKKMSLMLLVVFFLSCSLSQQKAGKDDGSKIESKKGLPSVTELRLEKEKKIALFKDAYNTPWVLHELEKMFSTLGNDKVPINEINPIYKNIVTTNVLMKLYKREKNFREIEVANEGQFSRLEIDKIQKGDIILTVSHNSYIMAADSEETLHHALLCIKDPSDLYDEAFITTNGLDNPKVLLTSLNEINENNGSVIVLRSYNSEEINFDIVIEYAMGKLGKKYNLDFTEKNSDEKFYCTQLIWKSYMEAGINIDENHFEYNDYGLVLASEIYRSPNLYIVDYDK